MARRTAAVFAAITSICASAFSFPAGRALSVGSTGRNSVVRNAAYSAELFGVITDPTGQPVDGAIVTLSNLRTNQKRTTKSDKKGKYRFIVSDSGPYRLQVTAEFVNVFEQDLALHAGDELRFDVSLLAGLVGVIVIEPVRERGFEINGVRVRIN